MIGASVLPAVRSLTRARGFAALTVLTLGVGIGATTAVFSAVEVVLLRPLPYPEPERVASIGVDAIEPGPRQALVAGLRVEPDLFDAVGAWRVHRSTMTAPGDPERVPVVRATEGLLEGVLGVQPFLGRAFLPEEHRSDGARTVVLSHEFWKERMGGDPGALGRSVGLEGVPYTVVGVMPARFRPPFNGRAELWIPAARSAAPCDGDCEASGVLARLREGATLPAARARVAAVARTVSGDESPGLAGAGLVTVEPLSRELGGAAASTLWLLMLGVSAASALAFVNIAVLNLVRASEREAEWSIRRALGAGRTDLARQLLVEAGLLAAGGTVVAVLLADWILEMLSTSAPPVLTAVDGIAMDGPTLTLAAGLGLLSALVSGLAPLALPMGAAPASGAADGAGRRRWVEWLMGGQVAFAVVLLVGAALLTRSLREANDADLGFDPHGLVALEVELPSGVLVDGPGRVRLLEELRDRVLGAPGVVAAGGVSELPLLGSTGTQRFALGAEGEDDRVVQVALLDRVTPGYFYTMGMRVVLGRTFDADDGASTSPVAVVNERWARSFADFPRASPVGRTIVQLVNGRPVPFTIVGVVSDIKQDGPRHPAEPAIYRSALQDPPARLALVVEVDDPLGRIASLRSTVASTHPGITTTVVGTLDGVVGQSIRSERFAASLAVVLATSILLIALVGVYGTVRRAVVCRLRELAIRFSLGARGAEASRFALRSALRFAPAGVLVGLALAWTASPLLERRLFGVPPHDPPSMLFALASMVLAASVALWGPARSAASVEPVAVLRE